MSILNPALDVNALAAEFAVKKRIQIQNVLDGPAAKGIDDVLRRQTKWQLVFNRGQENFTLTQEQIAAQGREGAMKLAQDCIQAARTGFQYLYYAYPIVDAILAKRDEGHPLHWLLGEINSPYFLDFIRKVTGIDSVVKADGQATFYGPGHFLTFHDDTHARVKRRIAYVLGFTKNWRADWGGLLEFYDKNGDVEFGMLPRFNSLSLFEVPAPHAVTFVAPYAAEGRYSVTGWFVDKP